MSERLNKIIVDEFFKSQLSEWDLARTAYDLLKSVQTRRISIAGFSFRLQFNQARLSSSSAKTDEVSIKERPCFLCLSNRPAEQRSIRYGNYDLLVNPYPIFSRHFTLASVTHQDQLISDRLGVMMDLAFTLPEYTVLYNGATCGASAPDHLHFQLGNRGFLPIEKDYDILDFTPFYKNGSIVLSYARELFNGLIMMECGDVAEAVRVFDIIAKSLDKMEESDTEPGFNLICWFDVTKWRIAIYLRNQHRPYQYYAPDSSKLLISPGVVDLGGVFITPLERDFKKLSQEDILSVLKQVLISEERREETVARILKNL